MMSLMMKIGPEESARLMIRLHLKRLVILGVVTSTIITPDGVHSHRVPVYRYKQPERRVVGFHVVK
jgi:hypothetical protein